MIDEDDWVKAHIKKFNAVDDAKELFSQLENNQKIDERIQKALKNLTVERKRRLPDNQIIEEKNDDETDDVSHIKLFLERF
ncbi:unnamed protein product [Onchocerca flexuosa]|uniref:CDC37_N domain-containing protein n=1 Tax=Onchocerca flexuosa TaxID=387005 RepID=A0A183HV39_9BILA|nr:unnamed protein product [Onchocerca flexuosa]